MAILTRSAEETVELGRLIGSRLVHGTFAGLSGELGSGKTTLARGIAIGLGVTANVTSPTFQLIREYKGRELLFHFDFYRLESGCDLIDLDINGCLERGIVIAEWAEKFIMPAATGIMILRFEWVDENFRRITLMDATPNCTEIFDYAAGRFDRA